MIICCLVAGVALAACGGTSSDAGTGTRPAEETDLPTEVKGAPRPPSIQLPTGPPPKQVVVEELREGQGAPLRFAQEFTLSYVALDYKTGKRLEDAWGRRAFTWVWGVEELVEGLEIGLEGMRVGGRRELIVPARFAYGADRIYLVELLRVSSDRGSLKDLEALRRQS